MNQITDFLKESLFGSEKKLYLFYDAYKVSQQYGFIAPNSITNYIRIIEAESEDEAIYTFVMNYYHDGIDWNLLDHKAVRDTYSNDFAEGHCPSFLDWMHESIEGKKIQTKSLVPFMKKFFINVKDQGLCISVQEVVPLEA